MKSIDLSSRGMARVYLLTAAATATCLLAAIVINAYTFDGDPWLFGPQPFSNVLISLIIASFFFFYLLCQLRELAIAHHELTQVASVDPLTNCQNRRAFTAGVENCLNRLAQTNNSCQGALIVIDIDHFKVVNDRYGHDNGDEALKLVADTIRANVRQTDIVARLGGEEFAIFLPGLDASRVSLVADRIRQAVQGIVFTPHGCPHPLAISLGAVTFSTQATLPDLYRRADQLLYTAKRNGRNRVVIGSYGALNPVGHLSAV